jgi:predicted component of type VI protein secretion system
MDIEARGKSLIISWRIDSKKHHKTLKKHNNPIGWSNAKSVMASIEKDILALLNRHIIHQFSNAKYSSTDFGSSDLQYAKSRSHAS